MKTVSHWIDGAVVEPAEDARFGPLLNPASGEVTGRVALASTATVEEAVQAAAAAFPAWRDASLNRRTQVIFAFRELLNQRKDELAAIITG